MFLILGLGNPLPEYVQTRHNLGYMVAEELALRLGNRTFKNHRKCHALISEADYEGRHLILAENQTFMNESGQSAQGLLHWYKIKSTSLILIYDDLDLEPGKIRIRAKGNAGGHHGVESVISHLKTNEFVRVRVGIGKPPLGMEGAAYVLHRIPTAQQESISSAVTQATDAVLDIVSHGIEHAMNVFNT
ncbi:MAG: aminoacyl-tRNA hydrolase [Candidatus Saganbacteria bacterium]|nr:aminoacyl-tRNA hydrolase [Candidatus Saganbacteria bacterium]